MATTILRENYILQLTTRPFTYLKKFFICLQRRGCQYADICRPLMACQLGYYNITLAKGVTRALVYCALSGLKVS